MAAGHSSAIRKTCPADPRAGVPSVNRVDLDCDLVLPCRDEGPALGPLLARVPPGLSVIVVDNGSRDRTADVAASHGALVVHEPTPGYGSAVHAGLLAASREYVAVMDGD